MKVSDKQIRQRVEPILDRYQRDPSLLVSILQDVQAEFLYLPKEAIKEVSRGLGIPLTRGYSVVTFFKAFSLKPRGRHLINVCLGTACHVRGAAKVLDGVKHELDILPGETTQDFKFTLETVNCVGACALGPIVIIDGKYHGQMTPDKVSSVLKNYT